jgi:hypothetical protein
LTCCTAQFLFNQLLHCVPHVWNRSGHLKSIKQTNKQTNKQKTFQQSNI